MTTPWKLGRRQFLAAVTAFAATSAFGVDSPNKLASDRHRPQFHLMPPANWMNDPNGPLFWNGKYHMFYQYSPTIMPLGLKYWGHAVSDDMVHWKNLGITLAPTPNGADAQGCWTGSAVVHNGVPTIIYTGAWYQQPTEAAARQAGFVPERQMMAVAEDPSDPNLLKWNKISRNPVIAAPPPGIAAVGWRDPSLWKEGGTWYMIIGCGEKGVGGMALMYKSADLIHWNYIHPLAVAKPNPNDASGRPGASMWECPDFFFLDGKPILLVAAGNKYLTGTYKNEGFEQQGEGQIDSSNVAYAQKTMADAKGRRIWWGWIRETRSAKASAEAGWAGVMSLPKLLTLRPDGMLGVEPATQVESLRKQSHSMGALEIRTGGPQLLDKFRGDCVEILAEIDLGDSHQAGLCVRSTRDGSEQTLVGYDRDSQSMYTDTMKSSLDPDIQVTGRGRFAGRGIQQGDLPLKNGEPLQLRIFVDASVIESFANGRASMTSRVYPTNADSLGIGLFAKGGDAKLRHLTVYNLAPISRDRLTSGVELFKA